MKCKNIDLPQKHEDFFFKSDRSFMNTQVAWSSATSHIFGDPPKLTLPLELVIPL